MGILDRIGGKLKAGLEAALAPAADPRVTYLTAQQRQRALLDQVAAAIEHVSAAKGRLLAKSREVRAKLPAMQDQAREELRSGHPDRARMALQRRQMAVVELEALEHQLSEIENEEAGLTAIEQRLSNQVEAFAARQDVIRARYSAAEAQVRINEALAGVSEEFADLTAALQRAEERTENMQARATAIDRLVQEGVLESTLTPDPDGIDTPLRLSGGEDLEEQLAGLQKEIAGSVEG